MDARLKSLLPLFAAVFIDIFSFGLMYPVIIALFHDPVIEQAYPAAYRDLYLSLAFSLFPLAMFFGASILGDLSDVLGRRRTLLICMAGLAVAYGLMWLAVETRQLLLFLAGRLLSGLMAGTSPIAQAAMMEKSGEDERGRNMSNVVLVNCVGLVAGPLVGGGLGHIDFRAPLAFALLLAVAAFVWIARSKIEERAHRSTLAPSWRRPIEIFIKAIRHPLIGGLALCFLLFQTGFGAYYIYIMVELQRVYGVSPLELGLFSAVMGIGFVIGTTLGYRYAQLWLRDDMRIVTVALAACAASICISAAPLPEVAQWPVAIVVCVTNVPAFVGLLTLISRSAGPDEQGWALGIGASMTALAFFIAGLAAAALNIIPLWALILAGGLLVALGLVPLHASRRATKPGLDPAAGDVASE